VFRGKDADSQRFVNSRISIGMPTDDAEPERPCPRKGDCYGVLNGQVLVAGGPTFDKNLGRLVASAIASVALYTP
jgi:hypothetical protein